LHFAVYVKTAAELVSSRVDSEKENMGLNSWKNSPDGKIWRTDLGIAKNYLKHGEIDKLNRIVNMYLDYAEDRAKKHELMTMED
jgi:hypothetical protein